MTSLSVLYVEKFELSKFTFLENLARSFRRNRTAAALKTLSDRQLSDIGINRATISSFVVANVK